MNNTKVTTATKSHVGSTEKTIVSVAFLERQKIEEGLLLGLKCHLSSPPLMASAEFVTTSPARSAGAWLYFVLSLIVITILSSIYD